MAEVLQATALQPAPVRVPAPGDLDPLLTDAMHAAYEQGHVAGFERGRAVGRAELEVVANQLATRITAAVVNFPAACVQARQALRYDLGEVAEVLLAGVLGHDVDLAGRGLIERLTGAIGLAAAALVWRLFYVFNKSRRWFSTGELIFWDAIALVILQLVWLIRF